MIWLAEVTLSSLRGTRRDQRSRTRPLSSPRPLPLRPQELRTAEPGAHNPDHNHNHDRDRSPNPNHNPAIALTVTTGRACSQVRRFLPMNGQLLVTTALPLNIFLCCDSLRGCQNPLSPCRDTPSVRLSPSLLNLALVRGDKIFSRR